MAVMCRWGDDPKGPCLGEMGAPTLPVSRRTIGGSIGAADASAVRWDKAPAARHMIEHHTHHGAVDDLPPSSGPVGHCRTRAGTGAVLRVQGLGVAAGQVEDLTKELGQGMEPAGRLRCR